MRKKLPPYVDADAARKRVIRAISNCLDRANCQTTNKMHLIKIIALRASKIPAKYGLNLNKISEYSASVWFNRIDASTLNKIYNSFSNKDFNKAVDEAVNEIKEMFNLK